MKGRRGVVDARSHRPASEGTGYLPKGGPLNRFATGELVDVQSQLQNWVGAVNYWDLRADFSRCRRSTSVAYFRNESLTPNRVPTCLCATFYQAPGTTFKTIFSPGSGRNSGRSPICTSGSS